MATRTPNYIATIPMKNEEQVLEVKKVLEQIFGWVTLRGRHTDRKSVVTNWRKTAQNDVSWKVAQYIDIYLHSANPNRQRIWKKQGMQRNNLEFNNTNVTVARILGNMGYGLADGVKHVEQSKGIPALQAIRDLQHQTQMNDPKYKRKQMKRRYHNKSYKLQPGDWGYITQELLNFVERNGRVSFSYLKAYYDIVLRGNTTLQKGGSFTHHLQALTRLINAQNRRCRRYLVKDSNDGKYLIGKY